MTNYIERKIEYINFSYENYKKQNKLSLRLFVGLLVGKKRKSEKIKVINRTDGTDKNSRILFEFGRFIPSKMYKLKKLSENWGCWELSPECIESINNFYDIALLKVL